MTDGLTGSGMGLSQTLPEGVVRGENVPPENDEPAICEALVDRLVGRLKTRGEPYSEMSESELRERARRILDESESAGGES